MNRNLKNVVSLIGKLIRGTPFENNTYLAGGPVRDELMERECNDIDICVSLPEGGIKLATHIAKQLNIFKEGSNPVIFPTFGTAKLFIPLNKYLGVLVPDIDVEFVMTRSEEYVRGNRKPSVKPGSLFEDVVRRDLTVNALLKNVTTGEIVDLVGGLEDIENRVIKCPLDPDRTICDDPLRMLRFIRFSVKLGFELPNFMVSAIARNASMLEMISKERIAEELRKILSCDKPGSAFLLMDQNTGLIEYMFPHIILWAYDVNRILDVSENDLYVRLAILLKGQGINLACRSLRELRFSSDEIECVRKILKNENTDFSNFSKAEFRKFKITYSTEDIIRILNFHDAKRLEKGLTTDLNDFIFDQLAAISETEILLPIDGNDIMEHFDVKSGPKLGKALSLLTEEFYKNPNFSREYAFNMLEDAKIFE